MPELIATLDAARKRRHEDNKFAASLKGIRLDEEDKSNAWEDMKARVFSRGKAKNAKDVMALTGQNAKQKGFGIGQGLAYASSDSSGWWKR